MKYSKLSLIKNLFLVGLILSARPLLAATPAVNNPAGGSDITTKGAANADSDVNTPKDIKSMPAGKSPSEMNIPKSQEGTAPGKSPSMPGQNQSQSKSQNQSHNKNQNQIQNKNQNIHPIHQQDRATQAAASIAYPSDEMPTGTPDTRKPPAQQPASSVMTPSQYKPGAANVKDQTPAYKPGAANTNEQPRGPAFIPQGDQRPLNERPEDVGKDQFQRQQYD